jgi:hypothetical protein
MDKYQLPDQVKKLLQTCHSIIPSGAKALRTGGQLGLPARTPGRLALLGLRASLQGRRGKVPKFF